MSIGSLGGQGLNIENLISQYMAVERVPIQRLQNQKSEMSVLSAIYDDIKSKISAAVTQSKNMLQTGTLSPFAAKSVSSSDNSYVSATASSSAAAGIYSIEVSQLARAQRLQSEKQGSSSESTGLTGIIRVQGTLIEINTENNSLQGIRDAINAATYTTGKGVTATIVDNRLILQSNASGTSNNIALQDISGNVLSGLGIVTGASSQVIRSSATASGSQVGFTPDLAIDGIYNSPSQWIGNNDGGENWLQIDLGSNKTINRIAWSEDRSGLTSDRTPQAYTIQVSTNGTDWTTVKTVNETISLGAGEVRNDVFDSVQARYVRMVITETNTGLAPAIDEFEIYDDSDISNLNVLQHGRDAIFKVNDIEITRSSNTGLSDVVDGLTLNLNKETETPIILTVNRDTAAITASVNMFLSSINSVTSYLSAKTAVTENADGTYTRQPLAGDYTYISLRQEIYAAISNKVSGTTGIYSYLSEIGITMDNNLQFSISDSTAFNNALNNHPESVSQLFNLANTGVASRIEALLKPFSQTDGILDGDIKGIQERVSSIENRIKSMNELLAMKQQQFRKQFETLQKMIAQISSQGSFLSSLYYSNLYNNNLYGNTR